MANVLHRTTKEFRASVNTPDYPPAQWIHEPNLTAVADFASKYWLIVGDVVTLMTAPQRAFVDAAEVEARRDAAVAQMDRLDDLLRATILVLLDELNLHAAKHNAILNAIDGASSFGAMKTAILAIADYPTRTTAQIRASIRGKLGT